MTSQNTNEPNLVPVLLILFNRPDKVRALIDALAKVKPAQIYISADGPRDSVPSDKEKCKEVRRLIQNVPWPCDIHVNFSDKNLGVDPGMETAISWFFQNVKEGIILEDDCIPDVSFFTFAAELLEKYRDTEEVFMISGTNFQTNLVLSDNASYYFSNYPRWGYAMWKRSWDAFDSNLSSFPLFTKTNKIEAVLNNDKQKKYWLGFFKKINRGKFSFTDTRILYAMWNKGGLCVIPRNNLIQNIGFGLDATHTVPEADTDSPGTSPIESSLRHPTSIKVNRSADDYFFETRIWRNLFRRIADKIGIIYRKLL